MKPRDQYPVTTGALPHPTTFNTDAAATTSTAAGVEVFGRAKRRARKILRFSLVGALLLPNLAGAVWETYSDRPGSDFKSFWIGKDVEAFVAVKQCEDACKADAKCKAFTFVSAGIQGEDGRCYLKSAVPNRVTNECCTSGVVRPETKADYCNNYALEAQLASTNNQNYHCGYTGNRWLGDYAPHYNWCMQVPQQTSQYETSERTRLLAECTKPTAAGDLAAQDVCYSRSIYGPNVSGGSISFYPIIANKGATDWRSKKKGEYLVAHTVGSILTERHMELHPYPYWELRSGESAKLTGSSVPYHPESQYTFGWRLQHSEDTNSKNNELLTGAFDTFSGNLTGSRLAAHPWLLAHKACTKVAPNHLPLNLYWDGVDLNGIPFNPTWGWQREHTYGSPDYYPDVPWLTPLLQIRHFKFLGYNVKKIGEERDFSKATNQKLFKEYGGNYIPGPVDIPVQGVCGPHVNWTIPVTYEGVLKGAGYDGDDGDYNFYLFTPNGYGAVKRDSNKGGIKVEFDSNETVDHFHTPWWSSIDKDGKATNNKYAIITALWGMDCAHECDSELHPAWAMAIRVKDTDPNDDTWAIFVRNWGNEGFCSDHVFPVFYPKQGNQYIYRFLLPWRPGASSVSATQGTQFLQTGNVAWALKPVPNKGVIVAFSLPHPNARPRINGELHLQWTYPQGTSPQPYPSITTAAANAAVATGKVELEDTRMNERIMQQLPPEQAHLYESILREANVKAGRPRVDAHPPLALKVNVTDISAVAIPTVEVVPDTVKLNRKHETLQRLRVDPSLYLQMQPIIEQVGNTPVLHQ